MLINPNPLGELGDWPFAPPDGPATPCFFCGIPLGTAMAVIWAGTPGWIHIHAACVPSLCRRLLEDWERANDITPQVDRLKKRLRHSNDTTR